MNVIEKIENKTEVVCGKIGKGLVKGLEFATGVKPAEMLIKAFKNNADKKREKKEKEFEKRVMNVFYKTEE